MLSKVDINSLFGAKRLTLEHMYSKACECLGGEKKQDLYIDFGSGAELIDSVMRDPYSKRVTFFYYFGEDRRSITLYETDEPTFQYHSIFDFYTLNPISHKMEVKDEETYTVLNLDGFFEHCEATLACGNKMPILYDGEVGEVCSIHRNLDTGGLDVRFSNYPKSFSYSQIIMKPAGEWEFTRKYPGLGQASRDPWVVKQKAPINNDSFGKNFLEQVDLELKKYGSQARVRIGDDTYHFVKASVNVAANKHGDVETFCSTSDTRLRVLKMGDETQLHLESAKKMKLD